MTWEEAKRYARRKCFYRKILHGYGYSYMSTLPIKVPELIKILKNIDKGHQTKLF